MSENGDGKNAAGGLFRFRVETPGLVPNRIRL